MVLSHGFDPCLAAPQTAVHPLTLRQLKLAGGTGVEPMPTESESVVLPLYEPPKMEDDEDFETSTCGLRDHCSASELIVH